MAFFGSSWFEEEDENIGPLSHLLEDFEYGSEEDKDPGEKGADDNE